MQIIDYSTETIRRATEFKNYSDNPLPMNPASIARFAEIICNDKNCKYPQLTLRIFVHSIAQVSNENKWVTSPRKISRKLSVHYDTVTKCLKYLRSIGIYGANH